MTSFPFDVIVPGDEYVPPEEIAALREENQRLRKAGDVFVNRVLVLEAENERLRTKYVRLVQVVIRMRERDTGDPRLMSEEESVLYDEREALLKEGENV